MRLMFYAARQVGLMVDAEFAAWYTQFIGFFVSIYETSAPPYAARDAAWSAEATNIAVYEAAGRRMNDVIGVLR